MNNSIMNMNSENGKRQKRVSFVELNVYERVTPLVSGYLQAYACKNESVKKNVSFKKYSFTTHIDCESILTEITLTQADLYAFSCYSWNILLVDKLISELQKTQPQAYFLLGGPQVMHQGEKYLSPDQKNTFVCNGEGEKTFSNFLIELLKEENADYRKVKGLSFYDGEELITTEAEERIKDMNEIPSPYLNGIFEGERYLWAMLETNRGCPFRCTFCVWGAATNDRVYKFDEQRIKEEIICISEQGTPFVYINDANWGMLKRDVEFSQLFVDCYEKNATPMQVAFSSAKNSPQRVSAITKLFADAGLLNHQPVSMQSLNEKTLEKVDRKNIKLDAYRLLQKELNEQGISSYLELIFPLPGETLSSFKKGIETLFESKTAFLAIYPNLLLQNSPMEKQRDLHGLITRKVYDISAEVEMVTGTSEIDTTDYIKGMWFVCVMYMMYNTSIIQRTDRYLHENELISFSEFYTAFSEFLRNKEENEITKFWNQSLKNGTYHNHLTYPKLYYRIFHENRYEFDALLYDFMTSLPCWEKDENVKVLFELDVLTKPFVYNNTPIEPPKFPMEKIKLLDIIDRSYLVKIPIKYEGLLSFEDQKSIEKDRDFLFLKIDHKKRQYPHKKDRLEVARADYLNGSVLGISKFKPDLESVYN